jgi:uncharacterized protein YjiS (DUF1127 family)
MLQCTIYNAAMQQTRFHPAGRHIKSGSQETKAKTMELNLIRNYRNWRRYRDTVSELNRLSNRELSDLGIARGDIRYIAKTSI